MKNNKGFTLVELLGIIGLLAILVILTFPKLVATFEKKQEEIDKSTLKLIYSGVDEYIIKNGSNYPKAAGSTYYIKIRDIDNENLFPIDVSKYSDKYVKVKVGKNKNNYEIIDDDGDEIVTTKEFQYTGSEQTFTVSLAGKYKLEVWGAWSGNDGDSNGVSGHRGYGGYSVGEVSLSPGDILYINIGGAGYFAKKAISNGGYNGGGNAYYSGSGGGATHIALNNGLGELKNYVDNQSDVLIVAGGGGGPQSHNNGGDGGGYIGGASSCYTTCNTIGGATQTTGYAFGQGESVPELNADGTSLDVGGGGGGWYGGSISGVGGGGSGGSGYIGSNLLINKKMVCYNCETTNDVNTRTETNTCHNSEATADCSKEGTGYARITYLEE